MNVATALEHRRSTRAFLLDPVDLDLLRGLLAQAARSPSGGNVQPWQLHVLANEAMARFRLLMRNTVSAGSGGETMEYDIYPKQLGSPYRERTYACGEALYAQLGIARENKAGRRQQFANNCDFFGAPIGLFCFVDRQMGPPRWADLGMYLQSLMLLLTHSGMASCAQECWAAYPQTVARFVDAPGEHMLFCGMAIGFADARAPVNRLRTVRAGLDDFARFHVL